jgi:hypothetical protein
MAIAELIYSPFIYYGSEIDVVMVNDNVLLNFFVSLPSRLIEYTILVFFVIKKRTLLKANIIRPIFESKTLTAITLVTLVIDCTFVFIMIRVICIDKILAELTTLLRLVIVLGVCIFPILNILSLVFAVY